MFFHCSNHSTVPALCCVLPPRAHCSLEIYISQSHVHIHLMLLNSVLSYTSSAPPGYDCNEKRFYNTGAWTWTQHSALSTVKWTFKTLKRFAMQWLYNLEKRFKLHDQGANYRIIHNIILYSVDNFGKDTLNIYNNIKKIKRGSYSCCFGHPYNY